MSQILEPEKENPLFPSHLYENKDMQESGMTTILQDKPLLEK